MANQDSFEERLSEYFGGYRAEWLKERLYDLFTEPSYLPELKTSRPCVLMGGRGTGKTTVLKCLSYHGQYELHQQNPSYLKDAKFFGIYYRINTNRVTAFQGPELDEGRWMKVFGHYVNLLITLEATRFLCWYGQVSGSDVQLPRDVVTGLTRALHVPDAENTSELVRQLEFGLTQCESYINNVADGPSLPLSIQGGPIDSLFEAIARLPQFGGRNLFILLDEYENLSVAQQKVINTLIKHCGPYYTFKIAIKELGWKTKSTLNDIEQLISPADYARIDINEKLEGAPFKAFAQKVCNERVRSIDVDQDVVRMLPGLSVEEEATALGVIDLVLTLDVDIPDQLLGFASKLRDEEPYFYYFLHYWAEKDLVDFAEVLLSAHSNLSHWKQRYENHKYAALFTLRRRKRGIRKYYCGWDTLLKLSANNIRFLLALVDNSLLLHHKAGGELPGEVSPRNQTLAAQTVGQNSLAELEGFTSFGTQLTKLALGLGRIFQVMAGDPEGHTPEVNSFRLSHDGDTPPELEAATNSLLDAGVMHLALERHPGNKLTDEAQTQDWEYGLHPIYAPFFNFSYRKKRKFTLSPSDIMGLVTYPRQTIREILLAKGRQEAEESLPDQLKLFEAYYGHS